MTLPHLISINDLSTSEMESIFVLAQAYLEELGDVQSPSRIGRSTEACRGAIMATLFYEPSTRTRLSFESAMIRLGGSVISSADPRASSAVKGESLADTVRIVSGYADLIALRHPREGAAKLAAEYASVPVINGGDGAHEHPTQTLCDLFTIRREKGALSGLNVAVLGDLQGGRTVHSLVYALARFGATITTAPAGGLSLPESVDWRLRNEFGCERLSGNDLGAGTPVGATYRPRGQPTGSRPSVDVLYLTRFQKERASQEIREYPMVNRELLSIPGLRNALVMHPLPRVKELDIALDADPRAAYFRQASYGVPIRMALVTHILEHSSTQASTSGGHLSLAQQSDFVCANPNCISRDIVEAQTAPAKFVVVVPRRLRCFYCEHEIPAAR
ncbi:MAG TPA: hypothetical protein VLC74_04025 [Rhizomicrobium sp.]|nr:hypothetical protein [Rhizomicrobium sp.]